MAKKDTNHEQDKRPATSSAVVNPSEEATPATYRIRVTGVLGEEWCRRAQGMTLTVHRSEAGGSFTELLGQLPDEAALMEVLEALYNHGARLLRVEHVDGEVVRAMKLGKWGC